MGEDVAVVPESWGFGPNHTELSVTCVVCYPSPALLHTTCYKHLGESQLSKTSSNTCMHI